MSPATNGNGKSNQYLEFFVLNNRHGFERVTRTRYFIIEKYHSF